MTESIDTKEGPSVSVVMIAYNNARYIGRAIEGVVRQHADFPIELWVSDDASTDNTYDVILHYASLYPDIVHPLRNAVNLGIQGNYLSVFPHCTGKYLAMCDADDYWCCRSKLSRQVAYMESHPDCAVTFHRVINLFEPSKVKSLSGCPESNDFTIVQLASSNLITNMSVLYRRGLVDFKVLPEWLADTKLLDYAMHMLYASHGYIHFMHRPMGVYRQWSKGAWSNSGRYGQFRMALDVRLHLIEHFSNNEPVAENLRTASVNIIAAMKQIAGDDTEKIEELRLLLHKINPGLTLEQLPDTPPARKHSRIHLILRRARIIVSRLIPAPRP